MNDDQKQSVEGFDIAMGGFKAYLDYVVRNELNLWMRSAIIEPDFDAEKAVETIKQSIMQHIAGDISENLPELFGIIGARLRKAAGGDEKETE